MSREGVTNPIGIYPMVLDSTIDYVGSDFYAKDYVDHRVYLPSDQSLVADEDTGEIKTVKSNV